MADIPEEPFELEEPEPILYESDEEEFEQTVLFDQAQFNRPEPEQFRYEKTDELMEAAFFSDGAFWKALREERKKRGLEDG